MVKSTSKPKNSGTSKPAEARETGKQAGAPVGKTAAKKSHRDIAKNDDYLWSMSHAQKIEENTHWFQMLPAAFFTAFVILIVRMYNYNRPMEQFFWSTDTLDTGLSDFFSYFKMIAILICAALAFIIILYRLCTQSLAIKRCFAYIPMAVYSLMVLLSYAFSEYKNFSLLGWNDRFEGTLVLLGYMVMLFFIINSVNTEKNVKFIIYPLAASSVLLSLLGIFQSIDKDPFRTTMGQKMIVPNVMTEGGSTTWQIIDQKAAAGERFLNFTFENKEIYQTVYNINYVSFYLTLLIPLFGMLFIRSVNRGKEEALWKKIGWGVLVALLVYNLIGSASSGGFLGLGVVGLMGIIILNKRILTWWKPVVVLMAVVIAVGGITYERWLPEISGAVKGVLGTNTESGQAPENPEDLLPSEVEPGSVKPTIDYIKTNERSIELSLNGNPLTMQVTTTEEGAIEGLVLLDADEKALPMYASKTEESTFIVGDDRFHDYLTLAYAHDGTNYYVLVNTPEMQWPFAIMEDQIYYRNQLGKPLVLYDVPHIGWEDNLSFGSGRGYIWSRTLPMLKDTALLGYGADTYCAYFPHQDYVGKYAADWSINMVVDKPHNMFMGMMSGTGGLSMLALLTLWLVYMVQSIKLYFKKRFETDYLTFVGAGIFFGIMGFIVSGLVNDSSVSVMPMFYGLLGIGIAINSILERRRKAIHWLIVK